MLYVQLPDYYAFKIHRLYVSVIQLFKNIKNEKMADFKMQLGLTCPALEINSLTEQTGLYKLKIVLYPGRCSIIRFPCTK